MFVSGFPSRSLFPHTPQQQAASSSSLLLPPVLLLSLSISPSVPAEPVLPSLSCFSPYTCQPLLSRLCLCSSLALGMVCLDAEEEEKLSGGAQLGGAPRLEERGPLVWTARFSVGTPTPRRLCKLYQEGVCSKCTYCATTHVQRTDQWSRE